MFLTWSDTNSILSYITNFVDVDLEIMDSERRGHILHVSRK